MRNYVIINGVNSNTINGLAINELPPITKPPMRVLQEEIDGRDGDITTNLGYGAYDKVMTIGLFHTFDINQIIAFFNGSGTIVFSNEPDKKYNYKIIDQIDYEKLISFKTATVTFHCQPFKYPLEETPLIIEPTTETLENVTSASIETDENTLSTTLKGNTSQYTTTGANVLESIATSNTTNIYEDVLWAEGLQANTTYTFQFVGVVGNRISGNANLFTTDTYHNITSGINTMILKTKSDISTSTGSQYTSGKGWRIFKNAKSDNVVNVFIDVMANVGSTALPYEPYTNGASPNPSYPQPINVVTGDNEVVVCGKNLWGGFASNVTRTHNYVDFVNYADGTISADGTSPSGSDGYSITNTSALSDNHYIVLEAGTYTLSGTTSISGAASILRLDIVDISGTIIATSSSTEFQVTFTLTERTQCFVRLMARHSNTFDNVLIKPMLVKGSPASEYEPYQSQTYPIYLGVENLFNKNNIITGSFYVAGGTSSSDNWALGIIPAKPNTQYYLSGNNYNNNVARIVLLDSSKSYLQDLGGYHDTHLITTSSTTAYIGLSVAIYSGSSDLDTLQLTKGTTPQHTSTTSIELCKIGDYKDYIYKDNGSWYIHKEIGSKVYTETDTFGYTDSGVSEIKMLTKIIPDMATGNYLNGLSNYFKNTMSGKNANTIRFGANDNSIYAYVNQNDISSLSAFQTMLASKNMVVNYILATPTNTIITDTTLISQLEALKGANSYYGVTNINQDNSDLPFMLDITYFEKDTDKAIVNNIGNIYSKPTIALEGNGTGGIYLNGNQVFNVTLTDKMTISTKDMEAYNPDTHALLNRAVTGNYNSMTLQPSNNTIKVTGGITKATITDYTRWL